MIILSPNIKTHSYQLIDSGDGARLEKWGNHTIIRPDASCIWHRKNTKAWGNADRICSKNDKGPGYTWFAKSDTNETLAYTYANDTLPNTLTFGLRTSEHSKNVGIFPEQAAHWDWLVTKIQNSQNPVKILNLFAYTGGATLVAAAAGAQVCHVDAARTTVQWARNNATNNNLTEAPIRWIVDDCLTFMKRELKRGVHYDGIIMDPPAFGRDPQGKTSQFEDSIDELLTLAADLLTPKSFLLLNAYGVPLYAAGLAQAVGDFLPQHVLTYGELHLKDGNGHAVPCNIFVKAESR